MRRALFLLSPLALAACMEAAPAADKTLATRQEAACAAAIADHIGGPITSVRWLSQTDGIATVETLDGNRRHLCTVNAAGRVTGYSHPR